MAQGTRVSWIRIRLQLASAVLAVICSASRESPASQLPTGPATWSAVQTAAAHGNMNVLSALLLELQPTAVCPGTVDVSRSTVPTARTPTFLVDRRRVYTYWVQAWSPLLLSVARGHPMAVATLINRCPAMIHVRVLTPCCDAAHPCTVAAIILQIPAAQTGTTGERLERAAPGCGEERACSSAAITDSGRNLHRQGCRISAG
jgi:hypothetical protein